LAHASKFFPTIAMQLTNIIPYFKKYLFESLAKHQDVADLSLADQWNHLIVEPLSNLRCKPQQIQLLIVIDALDECDGDTDIRIVLRLFAEIQTITLVQFRVLITSRPETPIRLGFDTMDAILHHDMRLDDVDRTIVDQDISRFLESQFSEISQEYENLGPDWPGLDKINILVQKSEGLFIYAATVCRFIKTFDRWSPEALLGTIIPYDSGNKRLNRKRKRTVPTTSPFTELDNIYTNILEHSLKRIKSPRDMEEIASEAREIVSTIAILFQPQPLSTLSSILDMDQHTIQLRLKYLGSLLSIPDDRNIPIRPLHPSFRDFLFDNSRCSSSYFSSNEEADHLRLTDLCLDILSEHLKEDICNVQQPGIAASDVKKAKIKQAISPEAEYACIYWIQHVINSRVQLGDAHRIYSFLRKHILHWFEALSWIDRLSDGIHALSGLELEISVGFLSSVIFILTNLRNQIAQSYSNSFMTQSDLYCISG
jgi:hypothetical protein